MGAIADFAVPQGGAISALPVPGNTVTPEDADVSATQTGAGPFRQGFRSGMNTLGANMSALIGQTGETLGLTEFANDRFKDAENYADFADRVGPPVRDFGQAKSAEQLVKLVAGMTGEALATSLPAVGASLALRRPVAGITAGTLPFSAGQQIQRERADPNSTATPGEVLTHGLEKGAVDSALYASLGGVGQGVKKILNPKVAAKGSMLGALAEGGAGNAAVGAGSSVAGDVIAKQGNPDQEVSYDDALNAAIGNAVPGAILSGAGHAIGALPGAAARSADELRTRLGKKERPPTGEPRLEDINENSSVDDIAGMLKDGEEGVRENLSNVWNKIKDHPAAQKFKDWATDPDQFEAFNEEVQKKYSDSEFKPKVDAALETGRKWYAGAKKYLEERGQKDDVKKNAQRTRVDDVVYDAMWETMPEDIRKAASPEQLLELRDVVKNMAENPDYFAETGVPTSLKKAFGDQFGPLMEKAVEAVHGPESRPAAMKAIKDTFKKHDDMEGMQTEEAQNLVRTHLKPEYLANPEMRKAAMEELAPKLIDYVNGQGKTDASFHPAMKEAFGDKTDRVMATLDRMQTEGKTRSVFESGTDDESHAAADPRLNKAYNDPMEAHKAREELEAEYGRKNVTIDMYQDEGTGLTHLHLEPADEMGLDAKAFARSREPAKYNRSGVENGVLTVKTDKHPQGAKINLVNLTNEMIRREGNLLPDTGPKYIADMFKRGIASLMASKDFHGFTDKGGLVDGTFPDSTPVAHLRGKTYTFGDIKEAGKLTKWDIAGFTRQDLIDRIEHLRSTPAGRGASFAVLRKRATDDLMEGVRAQEMAKTLGGRMEQRTETIGLEKWVHPVGEKGDEFEQVRRPKHEEDDLVTEAKPAMRERDPLDKKGEMIPRTYEEDTGKGIGEYDGPPRTVGGESKPSEPPHGEGPKSEKGMLKANATTAVQTALNMSNPKVAKAAEELTKGWDKKRVPDSKTKFSLMDSGAPDMAGELKQALDTMSDEHLEQWHETVDTLFQPYVDRHITESQFIKEYSEHLKTLAKDDIDVERVMLNHDRVDGVRIFGTQKIVDALRKVADKLYQDHVASERSVNNLFREKFSLMDLDEARREKLTKRIAKLADSMSDEDYNTLQNDRLTYKGKFDVPSVLRGDFKEWLGDNYKAAERETAMAHENVEGTVTQFLAHVLENPEGYTEQQQKFAAHILSKGSTGPSFSAMNIGKGPQTTEMQQAVKDYVAKVLGTKKTEVLFEKMKHAGEFAKLDGVETMKISIDASDPMSVGYHESVHALVSRLMTADPKAAHTLMRAASAAPIVARLRELLAGHPEALKQLADPEERLAYMYQFWASGEKGLLSVGPNTRTFFDRVKGFFGKIGAIWADDAGSAQAVDRAGDILTAFHNGDFAERSTVAKVLAEKFPPNPDTQLRKVWPNLGKFMDHVIYTAGGSVRDMNIQSMSDIMDKFHTPMTGTGHAAGFNQVKRVEYNRFMNRVVEAIKGLDDEQKAALVEEMQSGKDRTSPAAKAIEQVNRDLFKYMVDKGVKIWADGKYIDLKEIKENYWHRIPNTDYLHTASGKEAFIEMLQKHGVKDPDSVYGKWAQDADSGSPKEDGVLGLSFFTPQINERTLQNIPDAAIAPFLEKDLFGTMSQYTQRAVRRAEYAERFGNRGEVIEAARKEAIKQGATPAQLKVFDSSVQAHEGTLGADINPKKRAVYATLMTYQNIRLLPLQLFSSFVDPLGIMVRGGTLADGGKAFIRGIRELVGVKEDAAHNMAKTIGSINTAFDQGLASDMANAQFMPSGPKWISEKFFKYNGMESWNRSLRIAATVAAHDFIMRHVDAPNEHSERMLAELNLKAKDVDTTGGQLDVHNPKIAEAMNRWVNEAILTPNPAHRPIYMSDPHYMLISHLKQYSYLFQKVILSRVANEVKQGNYSPAFALAGYVPAIIAADMARMAITPTPNDNSARAGWSALDWLWSGVQRAGIFGPGQMGIGTAMDTRQNRIPGQNLLGPTVEQLVDFLRATAQGTGLKNELVNAIPGLKLIKGTGHETLPVGDE